MAEDLPDLGHGRSPAEHTCGEGMTKQMRSFNWWVEAGAIQGSANDGADCARMVETTVGCSHSHKDPPRGTLGAIIAQVRCQGFSDILREREAILKHTLTSYCELANSPVDIVQFQSDYFPGPQSEACEEKKNRVIPSPDRSDAIASMEKTFDLFRFEVFGHLGQPPGGNGQNGF